MCVYKRQSYRHTWSQTLHVYVFEFSKLVAQTSNVVNLLSLFSKLLVSLLLSVCFLNYNPTHPRCAPGHAIEMTLT